MVAALTWSGGRAERSAGAPEGCQEVVTGWLGHRVVPNDTSFLVQTQGTLERVQEESGLPLGVPRTRGLWDIQQRCPGRELSHRDHTGHHQLMGLEAPTIEGRMSGEALGVSPRNTGVRGWVGAEGPAEGMAGHRGGREAEGRLQEPSKESVPCGPCWQLHWI